MLPLFPVGTEFDPSMATQAYIVKSDLLEATHPHVILLDSKTTSSTTGSCVSGRGQGRSDGLGARTRGGEMPTFSS